jgi:AcrR family transcriptional regulator
MRKHSRIPDLRPRKLPVQRRSQATFDAIVESCAWLLPRLGYARTTTNHIAARAGVNISSLYEYFPGKDAIVAQVAERLVNRVLKRLAKGGTLILEEAPEEDALKRWIELVYETVRLERDLMGVFTRQVPYASELEALRRSSARLLEFSQELRRHAGGLVRPDLSRTGMQLIVNLVSSTILQLVLDPPDGTTDREVLDELSGRVDAWMRPSWTATVRSPLPVPLTTQGR